MCSHTEYGGTVRDASRFPPIIHSMSTTPTQAAVCLDTSGLPPSLRVLESPLFRSTGWVSPQEGAHLPHLSDFSTA
ncbi:hypothetical protein QQF64_003424 [Cirrhinus molitorella]|uniref:Uncharacterized protein n=1 Tax=Cirrhinus molitorella TaxID=172907 RepID=A0ABR3MLA4_9TELE